MEIKSYEELLDLFENKPDYVDETEFYFKWDPNMKERYLGFVRPMENPYWAGYCDNPEGEEYKTAKELLEAKIWYGKSVKECFDEMVIYSIGGINIEEIDNADHLGRNIWDNYPKQQ